MISFETTLNYFMTSFSSKITSLFRHILTQYEIISQNAINFFLIFFFFVSQNNNFIFLFCFFEQSHFFVCFFTFTSKSNFFIMYKSTKSQKTKSKNATFTKMSNFKKYSFYNQFMNINDFKTKYTIKNKSE